MACVLFTDLVGSTALMAALGEEVFDELRRAHFVGLQKALATHGGTQVKSTGDGIMATFGSAVDAVACAVAMQQATACQAQTGSAALAIRVGLSLGEVTFEEADVYGVPVVEAARLVAVAKGGQILTTAVVRTVAGNRSDACFADLGCLELKGLPAPVAACEVAWEPVSARAAPLPNLLSRPGRIFVGRDSEMEHLGQLWRDVRAGDLRVALVAGEPGVGKTRLAAELAARVHAEGATVLAGRCDEDLGVPYQPFVEALRHDADHTPNEELGRRLGRYGGELARLVPELGERAPGLPPPLRSEPETERYRLFDAVASWLSASSAKEPILLVLDDLQWAAKPTLLLLRHVIGSQEPRRLLVVVTYRDSELGRTHPLTELLADLRRKSGVERISLSGLDRAGVSAFLQQAAGHKLGPETDDLARAIHDETEGNAFFMREVVRHLIETRGLHQEGGRWVMGRPVAELGIPEGVRDVVGRRLSRLSDETNRVLACASVVGLEFEPAVVQTAGGFPEDVMLCAMDEAVAARLVVEPPGAVSRNRFSHALVRATLYGELTATRRMALHRKVAQAIEAVHVAAIDDYLPALAHHWARASTAPAETTKAVEYAARAGDRALAQLAHDEAVTYYREALDLLDAAEGLKDNSQRALLLVRLGEGQRRAGDAAHRQTLLDAATVAESVGDATTLAGAALANHRGFFSLAGRVDGERVAVLERALDAIGSSDSRVRARLLANLAEELGFSSQHERRERLAAEALAIARGLGEPTVLAHVLARRFSALVTTPERHEEMVELAALAAQLDDAALVFWARLWVSQTDLVTGDVEGFHRGLDGCARLAEELGQPTLQWTVAFIRTAESQIAGKLREAEEQGRRALELAQAAGVGDAFQMYSANLFWVRYEQGRLGEVLHPYERAAGRPSPNPTPLSMLALAYGELGRLDEARDLFNRLSTDDFAALSRNFMWIYSLTIAAEVCGSVGDAPRAATLYDRLVPYRGLMATAGAAATGCVDHYLGLLAAVLGRFGEADGYFHSAALFHERLAAPTRLARTRLEWARMLLSRGDSRDAERAAEFLQHALTTARELGLGNVERHATALLNPVV
jgi:class 3 adenylate cyclase/tetratricopeptide (TPR) repeat protein